MFAACLSSVCKRACHSHQISQVPHTEPSFICLSIGCSAGTHSLLSVPTAAPLPNRLHSSSHYSFSSGISLPVSLLLTTTSSNTKLHGCPGPNMNYLGSHHPSPCLGPSQHHLQPKIPAYPPPSMGFIVSKSGFKPSSATCSSNCVLLSPQFTHP